MKAFSTALAVSLLAAGIGVACNAPSGNAKEDTDLTAPAQGTGSETSPSSQPYATVLFTGDVLLDRGVARMTAARGDDYVWQGVDSLFHTADAVVVNLECPVTKHNTPVNKQYIFRASPSVLPAMARAGVTHATLANNHTMDQGYGGLADTDSLLRIHGIEPLGMGHKPQAVHVAPHVAIISALQVPVENWTFAGDYANVCCCTADTLVAAVKAFRARHPDDHLVLCLHWGGEYQPHCTPRQKLDAHRLVEAGASAIVGHHPHVLQDMETYGGHPVFYSLGNFIFDNPRPETRQTGILSLTFTPDSIIPRFHPATIVACRPLLQANR